MKPSVALERFYVLPCCLLLLHLANEVVSYKAQLIYDSFLRTLFIMGMVLFGSSLVAFAVSPAIVWAVQSLRRTSRTTWGGGGEALFLVGLGIAIFFLFYRVHIVGIESVLPAAWRNPR